jgi:hypothetical protein
MQMFATSYGNIELKKRGLKTWWEWMHMTWRAVLAFARSEGFKLHMVNDMASSSCKCLVRKGCYP